MKKQGHSAWPRTHRLLFGLAVLLHLYLLAAALGRHSYLTDDSIQYLTLAENLTEEGAYSQAYMPPYPDDTQRPPGYPVFLALTFGSAPILLILQHILVFFTGVEVFLLARRRLGPHHARLIALIYLLMPYPAVMASMILSESLFIFLFMTGLRRMLEFQTERNMASLVMGLLTLSLSALVRPVAYPVMIIGLLILLIYWLRKGSYKYALIMICIPAIVMGPWMLRNRARGAGLTLSSMDGLGFIYGRLGGFEAWRHRKPGSEDAIFIYGDSIAGREFGLRHVRSYPLEWQSQETEQYISTAGLTLSVWAAHPGDALLFQVSNVLQMMRGSAHGWSLQVTGSGIMALGLAGWQMLCNLLMYAGWSLALSRIRRWKAEEWALALCIFIGMAASAAVWADGRYRMVWDGLSLVLAGYSLIPMLIARQTNASSTD